MAYFALLLAVCLDAAFAVLAPDRFGMRLAPPDLPLITALYIGFHARDARQLGLAIWLGVIADCFSVHPIGHFAFLYGAGAYVAQRIRRYLPPDAALSYILASLVCGCFVALTALLLTLVRLPEGGVAIGFGLELLQAATSAVAAPLVFGLWERSRLFRNALGGRRYGYA